MLLMHMCFAPIISCENSSFHQEKGKGVLQSRAFGPSYNLVNYMLAV